MGVAVKIKVGVFVGGGWVAVGEGRSVAVGGRIVLVGDAGAGDWVGVAVSGSRVGDSVMMGMVADSCKAGAAGEQAARQAIIPTTVEQNLR